MTYRGDKTRERKHEKAQAGVGHDKHGARRRSSDITGGRNGKMRPYLDSKCFGNGVAIEAWDKAELLAHSIRKWCGDGDATWWQSWRRQWQARHRLCGCESERGRGNERERADGHVVAMLKASLARLVGHAPVYGRHMVSVA